MSTDDEIERKSWLFATVIVALLAITMFLVQRLVIQVFDFAVEIFVFYAPAIILAAFYLSRRFQKRQN